MTRLVATRSYAIALSGLALLFLLRVLGQALVAFAGVTWLPPMSEWYSGLLAYPFLLPVQVLILAIQAWISLDFARGRGVFVEPRRRLGRTLRALAFVYFLAMVLRHALTMTVHPEPRWLGTGTIPVVFHWTLAAYLYTLARYHLRAASAR
jgi:hypothetical protein